VLCHGGGFLPYAAFRASLFSSGAPVIAPPPGVDWSPPGIDRLRRFYLETALTASPTALPSLLAFAAPGHLLFGSDFPFAPAPVGHAVTRMLDAYEMPDAVRRSIDRGAAEALFPRLARPGSTTDPSAGRGPTTGRSRSLRWLAGRSTRVRRPER
jgi:6-methylsalicylate decarboxylase